MVFGTRGIALGGYFYDAHHIKLNLALIFTFLNALVDFATEGFGAH